MHTTLLSDDTKESVYGKWIFEGQTKIPKSIIPMNITDLKLSDLVASNANAYLDLNNDFIADLFLESNVC